MNIFVVNTDPELAARDLCDQHVVKMVLETAQLLCTAFPDTVYTPYKPTHKNHPAAVWTRQSLANFMWLAKHGLELGREYTRRYGRTHASAGVVQWCVDNTHLLNLPTVDQTPFVLCMPNEYKTADPVESYRAYYRSKTFARWKYTNVPNWMTP